MEDRETVAHRYVDKLTDRDLLALADERPEQVPALRREPSLVLDLLDRPSVTDMLLADRRDPTGRFRHVSPFLLFAAAVHRTAGGLVGRMHVPDRSRSRSALPVFDGPVLAAFAADPAHRLFLAELLTSYAKVASGVLWRRDERGWRRQRWDELDLPRLAALLDSVPAEDRPGVWRRIGDGALFLAGVFPEYAQRTLSGPGLSRLERGTGVDVARVGAVQELLEQVAERAYGQVPAVPPGVAEAPRSVHRVLSLVAQGHLFPADLTRR